MAGNAPRAFIEWLNEQIKLKGWTVRETARRAGISHTPISYALGGEQPSFDTCMALARVFEASPVAVLTLAGLLPGAPQQVNFEDWKRVLGQLSEHDQLELLEFAKLKLRMQEQERVKAQSRNSKPAEVS